MERGEREGEKREGGKEREGVREGGSVGEKVRKREGEEGRNSKRVLRGTHLSSRAPVPVLPALQSFSVTPVTGSTPSVVISQHSD